MSRTLALLRHAKSDWDTGRTDFDRPLNKRGRKDAPRIGVWLKEQPWRPALILSSPALRARQTIEAVVEAAALDPGMIRWERQLYLADRDDILALIRALPPEIEGAVLVGHNPGMEDTLNHLSRDPVPETDAGKGLTTANLALLEFDADWSAAGRACAALSALVRPADLDP